MSFERLHTRLFYHLSLLIFALLLAACSITAPVQEMSNARQSIKAAKEVNAEVLAADILTEANQRLKSAMRELDAGEYERARILAVEAKHLALKARQLSVSKKAE
jgi:HAMP domain-containing protein